MRAIICEGTLEEIAALVVATQERPSGPDISDVLVDGRKLGKSICDRVNRRTLEHPLLPKKD